jgi:hypothetical protein
MAHLGTGPSVGEGHVVTPVVEWACVLGRGRARWCEFAQVAGYCHSLAVKLARLKQPDGVGNAQDRQAGYL